MIGTAAESTTARATAPYVAPFAGFVAIMTAERALSIPPQTGYTIRVAAALLLLLVFSRGVIGWRPSRTLASIAIGAAVCAIWIAPDALFAYRHSSLFENSLTGRAETSVAPELRVSPVFLALRAAGSTLVVPVIEELFWRAWLMRWLIDKHFLSVKLGTYAPGAFWITAILFASEHGAYWEVGLAAGVIYNWWLIRTRNLADCILAHAVTNGLLAAWVLGAGQWQYWL